MGNIILLDEHTVNKIAAGEVVDRPSSIVKELVENSIDAGATAITVEIRNGGIAYIKIVDNGVGFHSDDIEMAFERHATSKIRQEEDLLKITSMGFRGEALASIAAISKVTLTTKNKDEEIGSIAKVSAGKFEYINQTATTQGTKIEIQDIFYNVPARFKFLKKDYTEAGYIEDVIIRIALANPHISFKYVSNSKVVIQTSGKGDLHSTIYDIFGKEIYQNVIPLEYEFDGISVSGMIGLPQISRSTRMHQFTFVNSRFIKDKTITSALDKACAEKFAINKFPFAVINLNINPTHIDVNVHPAKLEIKFENESQIFQAVYAAVKTALEKKQKEDSPFTNIIEERKVTSFVNNVNNYAKPNNIFSSNVENDNVGSKSEAEKEQSSNSSNNFELNYVPKRFDSEISKSDDVYEIKDNLVNDVSLKEDRIEETIENNVQKQDFIPNVQVEMNNIDTLPNLPQMEELAYKYVGQVFDTYIIIQIKDKMYIIDQHAAHERLLYEQIKSNYYSKDRQSQLLLIPILVELTSKEKSAVDENIEMFEKTGFIIDDFGDNAIKISGVPNIGYDIEYKSMFKDIIDELLGAMKTEKSEKEFRFLATVACKAAVKGNMKLDEKEQKALISEMIKLERPFTCPHGRPTAYEISKYEIERRFLRK